jgi:hypothetical protein
VGLLLTLDQISPARRVNLILPPGVSRAKLERKNDPVHANAKWVTISLWVVGRFSFGWRSVHFIMLRAFGLEEREAEKALERAEQRGWLEIKSRDGPTLILRVTERIFEVHNGSAQQRLPLSPPHHDVVIQQVEIACSGLRLLLPQRFIYDRSLYAGHKLLFVYMRALNGFSVESLGINYSRAGKHLGLNRKSVEPAVDVLAKFADLTTIERGDGGARFDAPFDRLYFPWEVDSFELSIVAAFLGDRVERIEGGDEIVFSSPPPGDGNRFSSPPGDGLGVSSPPPLESRTAAPGDENAISSPERRSNAGFITGFSPTSDNKNPRKGDLSIVQPQESNNQGSAYSDSTDLGSEKHIGNLMLERFSQLLAETSEQRVREWERRIMNVCRAKERQMGIDANKRATDGTKEDRHLKSRDALMMARAIVECGAEDHGAAKDILEGLTAKPVDQITKSPAAYLKGCWQRRGWLTTK